MVPFCRARVMPETVGTILSIFYLALFLALSQLITDHAGKMNRLKASLG